MKKSVSISALFIVLAYFCCDKTFAQQSPGISSGPVSSTQSSQQGQPASGSSEDVAKQLANPVASLISVPFQNNTDFGVSSTDTYRNTLNIQPVIPFSLNENYNLITRTIIPVVAQGRTFASGSSEFGLGDILQSLFFSPKKPVAGLIVGVGPAISYPTGTSKLTGSGKWAAGPTMVIVKQNGAWTYGALVNHVWSFAGPSNRSNVSNTFVQPFLSHTSKNAVTLGLNAESSYDWEQSQWTVPLNISASKVVKVNGQLMSFGAGAKLFVDRPSGAPRWGMRFIVTLLFPKK